jgi:hypothetical protein
VHDHVLGSIDWMRAARSRADGDGGATGGR